MKRHKTLALKCPGNFLPFSFLWSDIKAWTDFSAITYTVFRWSQEAIQCYLLAWRSHIVLFCRRLDGSLLWLACKYMAHSVEQRYSHLEVFVDTHFCSCRHISCNGSLEVLLLPLSSSLCVVIGRSHCKSCDISPVGTMYLVWQIGKIWGK